MDLASAGQSLPEIWSTRGKAKADVRTKPDRSALPFCGKILARKE